MLSNFRSISQRQVPIDATKEAILNLDAAQLGASIHVYFLSKFRAAASLFSKTLRVLITTKIIGTLMAVVKDPGATLEDVRQVGVRHTKYGISERYLLPFAGMFWEIVAQMLPDVWTPRHIEACSFYLDFVATVMVRAIGNVFSNGSYNARVF